MSTREVRLPTPPPRNVHKRSTTPNRIMRAATTDDKSKRISALSKALPTQEQQKITHTTRTRHEDNKYDAPTHSTVVPKHVAPRFSRNRRSAHGHDDRLVGVLDGCGSVMAETHSTVWVCDASPSPSLSSSDGSITIREKTGEVFGVLERSAVCASGTPCTAPPRIMTMLFVPGALRSGRMWCGLESGAVMVLDGMSGERVHEVPTDIQLHTSAITCMCLCCDSYVVCGSDDGTLTLTDAFAMKPLCRLRPDPEDVDPSNDGIPHVRVMCSIGRYVYAVYGNVVLKWDVFEGDSEPLIATPSPVTAMAGSGQYVWIGLHDGRILVVNTTAGIVSASSTSQQHTSFVRSIVFVTHSHIWSASDREVIVWDAQRMTVVSSVQHSGSMCLHRVVVSPEHVTVWCPDVDGDHLAVLNTIDETVPCAGCRGLLADRDESLLEMSKVLETQRHRIDKMSAALEEERITSQRVLSELDDSKAEQRRLIEETQSLQNLVEELQKKINEATEQKASALNRGTMTFLPSPPRRRTYASIQTDHEDLIIRNHTILLSSSRPRILCSRFPTFRRDQRIQTQLTYSSVGGIGDDIATTRSDDVHPVHVFSHFTSVMCSRMPIVRHSVGCQSCAPRVDGDEEREQLDVPSEGPDLELQLLRQRLEEHEALQRFLETDVRMVRDERDELREELTDARETIECLRAEASAKSCARAVSDDVDAEMMWEKIAELEKENVSLHSLVSRLTDAQQKANNFIRLHQQSSKEPPSDVRRDDAASQPPPDPSGVLDNSSNNLNSTTNTNNNNSSQRLSRPSAALSAFSSLVVDQKEPKTTSL
eukprot:PhM_4_TR15942/c0_g1_i2/m.50168